MHLLFADTRRKPRVAELGRQFTARLSRSAQISGDAQAKSVVRVSCYVSIDVMCVTWTATFFTHVSVHQHHQ